MAPLATDTVISDEVRSQQVFFLDVEQWVPLFLLFYVFSLAPHSLAVT